TVARAPQRSITSTNVSAGTYIATTCQAIAPTVVEKPRPQPTSPMGANAITAIIPNHANVDVSAALSQPPTSRGASLTAIAGSSAATGRRRAAPRPTTWPAAATIALPAPMTGVSALSVNPARPGATIPMTAPAPITMATARAASASPPAT